MEQEIASPCINLCRVEKGICVGCKRTPSEIARWVRMSDEEKEKVLKIIKKR